ncbi:MAG: DegT/DnrJ/EryC1/StrS family aminotransferase [Planctomycetota bacterium]
MSVVVTVPHSRPTIVAGMQDAVAAVVASEQHAGGGIRREFERALGRRLGVSHAVAVQSGLAALHLALLALGVRRGQRVLVPSYVCAALLHAIDAVGARPLVADVDPRTFNLDALHARQALAREHVVAQDVACAIVPHLFGYPAPLHLWDLEIPVIEDCAMALGASIGSEEVGVFGVVSVFSFYATKMISTGQGGLLATNQPAVGAEALDLIQYDNRSYWRPCWNYPLPDLGAALGKAQLPHLDGFLERRRDLAVRYRDALRGLPVGFQEVFPETTPACFRFVVLLEGAETRDRLQADLAAAGVETKSPVFRPLHAYLGLPASHFPNTEQIQARALSLPIYPALSAAEQEHVIDHLRRSLES